MMNRLEMISTELVRSLGEAGAGQRRAAVSAACEVALASALVHDDFTKLVLEKVRSGREVTADEISHLNSLVEAADDEYFTLQESGDSDDLEYLRHFKRARALSSLAFASKDDSTMSSSESIYEAMAAVDNRDELIAHVVSAL